MITCQPPLKGEAAHRAGGVSRYAEYHSENPGRIRTDPLLPPLGEVPRSGKGGVVGSFELFPFNERHPLSQPCRFRSAVKSASSPIGEPSLTSPERGGGPRVSVAEGFAVRRIPFRKSKANSYRPSLPPLGEVPRSGKGGAVGDFEQFPFNERHPLSLANARQLPHWGAKGGLARIRPRFHKTASLYRETPQSALTGCQLPFQGRF